MSVGHGHHGHDHGALAGDDRVLWAVAINGLLTVAQIVGGIMAGSLALIADALHNFSDAAALFLAWIARRISRRRPDESMTFGYVRAEIVSALINYTTLILIGLYLMVEAITRFIQPQPVDGWPVIVIAGAAVVVDSITAWLTYALSKGNMNMRAVFLHNMADVLGAVAVVIAGALVLLLGWQIADPVATILISAYILWQALSEIGAVIRLLMMGTPPGLDVDELVARLRATEGVADVHHLHFWQIDEQVTAFEAHIVVRDEDWDAADEVRHRIKSLVRAEFSIAHSTLELERPDRACDGDHARLIGHRLVHGHEHAAHGEAEHSR